MTNFICIQDFPDLSDQHESTRNLLIFTNTHPVLRRYRDFLATTIGPNQAYDHLTYVIYRSLKDYFHETFGMPFFRLRNEIEAMTFEALTAGSFVTLAEHLHATDRIREEERARLEEITDGAVNTVSHGFFPDDWDSITRLRHLFAMRASLLAQEILPAVPDAAVILAREFKSDIAVPQFDVTLTREQRREIRSLWENYPVEEAETKFDAYIEEHLPPQPPLWDFEAVIEEICQAVIRTFLGQVEDDAFMDEWVEKIRPMLNEYGEPTDEVMRNIEAFLADTERSSYRRFPGRLYSHVLDWIAAAQACGYPIDERVLNMTGYQAP